MGLSPHHLSRNATRESHHGLAATAACSREAGYICANCLRRTSKTLQSRGGPYIFCGNVLQNRLVQAQLGHQLLEPRILVLQLPKFTYLIRLQPRVLLLPAVKRLLGDAMLPAQLGRAQPASPCFRIEMICSSLCRMPFNSCLLSAWRTYIVGWTRFRGVGSILLRATSYS